LRGRTRPNGAAKTMKPRDMASGLLAVGAALAASSCCVLPLAVVALGLGSGAFMFTTMPYRPILFSLGLLGVGASWVLYARRRRACAALACRMAGQRTTLGLTVLATVLLAVVTYVDFFLTSL
jgi:mercuric ion transport protein